MTKTGVRKRNVAAKTKVAQKKNEEETKVSHDAKSGSSSGLMVVLIVMVAVTWGVAATSYFGVVDYKGLLNFDEEHDIISKETINPPKESKPPVSVTEVKPPKVDKTVAEEKSAPEEPKLATKEKIETKNEQPTKQTPVKPVKNDAKKKNKSTDLLTSADDVEILAKIKEGEKLLANNKISQAKMHFEKLVKSNPKSPRALYGLAQAEELVAEQQRSNPKLVNACEMFTKVAQLKSCTDELKKKTLLRASDKYYFLGKMRESLVAMRTLANDFPDDIEILNKFGVSFLFAGMNKQANDIFERALKLDPDDGFALVHKGFIMKSDGDWENSIPLLRKGVLSNDPGTQEGKFYFHLGDALYRTGNSDEAEEVYELGTKRGLFRSKYQRSLYNVDHLKAQPYWTAEEAGVTDYVRRLKMNWKVIKKEALSVLDEKTGLFKLEDEGLKDTGEWRQFTLYQRGKKMEQNCERVPKTCMILDRLPNAIGCRRGQIKFSVMMPGTHIWPHTGPTNCRLRMHLGLVIPTTGEGSRLICAKETRHWEEGKVLIFDDSFEHEVYQNAESFRIILIVDIWHPELTDHEKRTLTAI